MNGKDQVKKRAHNLPGLATKAGPSPKRQRLENAEIEVVDLSDDDDDEPSVQPSTTQIPHRSRTNESATHTLPTPNPTPNPVPNKGDLHNLPELTDRYVAKTSTAEAFEYKNPRKFGLKPAYWQRWGASDFMKFAEHLREQFDPIPFAKETDRPVEEVKHVFYTLVVNPLYDCYEAKRRGKEGMDEIFKLYERCGTPTRKWSEGMKGLEKVKGELYRVGEGSVQINLENGSKKWLKLKDLSEEDVKYLRYALTEDDERTLWTTSVEPEA